MLTKNIRSNSRRQALSILPTKEEIVTHIENTLEFLTPVNLKFTNSQTLEVFTSTQFEDYIPEEVRKEARTVGYEHLMQAVIHRNLDEINMPETKKHITRCDRFKLKNMNVSLSVQQLDWLMNRLNPECSTRESASLKTINVTRAFGRPMPYKKAHEVNILSGSVARLKDLAKVNHLVDIGDGKGYLSSILAMHYNVPVLGIDSSNYLGCEGVQRAAEMAKVRRILGGNESNYRFTEQYIDEQCNLMELVRREFNTPNTNDLGLIGLHTCGNLAPNSLRIFTKNDYCRLVCNVGCCYHYVKEQYVFDPLERIEGTSGFPLSNLLNERKVGLGRRARAMGSFGFERVEDKHQLPGIKVFYRAVLHSLLVQYVDVLPSLDTGRMNNKVMGEDFIKYVRFGIEQLKAEDVIHITDADICDLLEQYRHRLVEVKFYFVMRNQISCAIESLILLDRLLYLHENGHECSFLVELFDPMISPRRFGIISIKS